MRCCGQDRRLSNYCPNCGKQLNLLPSLLEYLEKMANDGRTNDVKFLAWIAEVEEFAVIRERLKEGLALPPKLDTLLSFQAFGIKRALKIHNNNRHKAAVTLQIGERTLYRWIERLKL